MVYFGTGGRNACIAICGSRISCSYLVVFCETGYFSYRTAGTCQKCRLVRKHAKEWYVDPDKIVVEGCSAGGHLAASYGVFWHEDFVSNKLQVSKDILKPNGMILSYPVITSGEFAHRGSFNNLLRDQYTEEMLEKTSLEKQVNEYVPRAFIWHTYEDTVVPVENSLLFATELRRHHIPVEFHLFERGCHGLSLANELTDNPQGERIQRECECWITMAIAWMHNL